MPQIIELIFTNPIESTPLAHTLLLVLLILLTLKEPWSANCKARGAILARSHKHKLTLKQLKWFRKLFKLFASRFGELKFQFLTEAPSKFIRRKRELRSAFLRGLYWPFIHLIRLHYGLLIKPEHARYPF